MPTIDISFRAQKKTVTAAEGVNLLEILREENIYIPAFCGGKGICGKCLFRVESGNIEIKGESGEYLACKAYIKGDCSIAVHNSEKDFSITSAYAGSEVAEKSELSEQLAVAVDIGTTTLAVTLIDLPTGRAAGVFTEVNEQRKYGADVISRIEKCETHLAEMTASVRRQILFGVKKLVSECGVYSKSVKSMAVVGNSVMMGIFIGEDCTEMGVAPFTMPEKIKTGISLPFHDIFNDEFLSCDVSTLPCISAYLGADALAAALFCGAGDISGYNLIADIGTNGELLLTDNVGGVLCASAAAGPALEGGNISCGMGGAAGAVCSVIFHDGKFVYRTISNKPPVGICGSGAIDLMAELIRTDIVDETGLLIDDYFDDGVYICENVTFTQPDIRQIQLAKSALRSGIDCLIEAAGINVSELNKVFLAGGFGSSANSKSLVNIGLLPGEALDKIELVGNAALGGAVKWLMNEEARLKCDEIVKRSNEIKLAEYAGFMDRFMDNMTF